MLVIMLISILVISAVAVQVFVLSDEKEFLYIVHAGSLAGPMEELEKEFEAAHPDVDVRRAAMGSTAAVREVTELGKSYDIVASADYTLIDSMMIDTDTKHAEFNIMFARNKMTLAYTDASAYKDELSNSNWYDILQRSDVKFGFSNPNDDPCGYRSLMAMQLAELYYDDDTIFDNLVESNTKITSAVEEGNYTIKVPPSPDISPNTDKLMMRSAEIHLMSALELGEIDYLFIYKSVAHQHRSAGVSYLELPLAVDLSDLNYTETYGRVQVETSSGKLVKGKPIVYGITIPQKASQPKLAEEFIELLLSQRGMEIFTEMGQPPIVPAVSTNAELLPADLKKYVESI
jgi:molybdate/tungstate transport system substrate-binding protein